VQLPPNPAARLLSLIALVDWAGTGMWLSTSAVFFARALRVDQVEIGAGVAAGGVLGVVAITPVAAMARRWSPRRVAIGLYLCRGLALLTFLAVGANVEFFVAIALVSIVNRPGTTVNQLLVARFVPAAERSLAMSATYVATNLGIGGGAAIGTLALLTASRTSFDAIVLLDSASYLAAALLIWRVLRPGANAQVAQGPSEARAARSWTLPLRDWRFALFALGNGLLTLHAPLLNVAIPLWVVTRTTVPAAFVGGLFLLNTALVVLLQNLVARRAKAAAHGVRAAVVAGLCLAGSCIALAAAPGPALALEAVLLTAGVALLTLGEMHQGTANWVLSFALAPDDERQSSYIGFVGTTQAAAIVLGPALLTWLMAHADRAGFVIAAGLVLGGAACVRAGASRRGR
jgi:hypothetical protein